MDLSNKGTKDGRLLNRPNAFPPGGLCLDLISLTITITHPRCDLAAISVIIDGLGGIHRDH